METQLFQLKKRYVNAQNGNLRLIEIIEMEVYKTMTKNVPMVEPLHRRLFTCYLEIINAHDTIQINYVGIGLSLRLILK